jgi:hypothetical protein
MTSKDETGLQMISIQGAWYRLLNATFGSITFLFGAIAFMAAIFITPLPVESNLYAIPWILMVIAALLALLRNIILQLVFRKISHSRFLSLVHFGRIVNYILVISVCSFFIISLLGINVILGVVSLGLFCIWAPIFLIFSEPLTWAGEIGLLFRLLLTNLDNFEKRQPYLRTISKKVENQLKIGNIKVPSNEFVYYFNMELFKGTDVQNDLKNIEAWMVDKKTPCFESLKKIYPENKFEPWKRIPMSRQFVQNPTILKYTLFVVVALILIAASPELQSDILRLLSRLLGT